MNVSAISPITGDEMVGLATTEYQRTLALITTLMDSDWDKPTPCSEWSVRLLVAHMLGASEANASLREIIGQLVRGAWSARKRDMTLADGVSAVQVKARGHLTPRELTDRMNGIADRAVSGRRKFPRLLRLLRIPDPAGGLMSIGHLMDAGYTRDQWLHRWDLATAIDKPFEVTAEHDGRIVEDVVAEWATKHDSSFTLRLTGLVGGEFSRGTGGPEIAIDAVEFCKVLGGRSQTEMPLTYPVVF